MAQFTVLQREEVEGIVEQYPIGTLLEFSPLAGGLANSSLKIETDAGYFVLSVCDEKDMGDIKQLCTVLDYLEDHDFPTTRVIQTKKGQPIITYEDKPLYVKDYIDGSVLEVLDTKQLRQVGAALARLHEITAHPDLEDLFSYGIECFDELKGISSAAPFYQWLSESKKRIAGACFGALPRGFIHGDLFHDNMLFVEGSLAALLDFEEACNYYKVFDIGMAVIGCCSSQGRFTAAAAASLVAGYQSIRQLEPDERQSLQVHVEYGAVATAFWRYRQYNIRKPAPPMKDHYRAMTDLAEQVSGIDPDQFYRAIFAGENYCRNPTL